MKHVDATTQRTKTLHGHTRAHVTGTHDTPARTHKDVYPNIYMRKKETLSIYIFPC